MGFTNNGKNLMLAAFKGTNPTTPVTHASLHTAAPGESGTSEVSGGSPAYARKAITFGTPSSGSVDQNGTDPVFDIPASTTVTHVGFWSAVTSGTFLGWAAVTNETFAAQGTYTLDTSTLTIT
jgi:hypothetical protein